MAGVTVFRQLSRLKGVSPTLPRPVHGAGLRIAASRPSKSSPHGPHAAR